MTLLLARHGETALNRRADGESAERIRGWLDVPLDADGKRQAAELADKLRGESVRKVYASNLERAYQTGQYVAAACHAPIEPDAALRPWNVGRWAGQDVRVVLPEMQELIDSHPDRPAPGGEAFADFVQRFLSNLKRLLSEAKGMAGQLCAVTHTRNLQLARAWVAAGAKDDLSYDPAVMNDYSDEVGTGDWITLEPK